MDTVEQAQARVQYHFATLSAVDFIQGMRAAGAALSMDDYARIAKEFGVEVEDIYTTQTRMHLAN